MKLRNITRLVGQVEAGDNITVVKTAGNFVVSAPTAGTDGVTPTLQWTFGSSTTDADPGNGTFLLDNATPSFVTFLYIDNLDINGATVTSQLDSWDDLTNSANRGTLRLVKLIDQATYAEYIVTGTVIDGTGYRKVPVSFVGSNSVFAAGDTVSVFFSRTGNAGLDGVGAGDTISDIASVTDGRVVIFNGTTGKHITNASYGIGTSGANLGALNANNTYSGTSAFTGAVTYSSTLIGTVANVNALTVGPNGSTNPTLKVNTATASAATGLSVTAEAATGGVALAAISSGSDETLTIDAKGSGAVKLGSVSTGAVQFSRNAVPTASDGAALGTTALMWSDLFLASGSVVNFNAGDVTLTHSSNLLRIAGGDLAIAVSTASTSSSTGALTISGGVGVGGSLFAGVTLHADTSVVVGSGAALGQLFVGGSGGTGWGASAHIVFASASGVGLVFKDGSGNNGTFIRLTDSAATAIGDIVGDGAGGVTYASYSDMRAKPNREPLATAEAWRAIDALKIWDFDKDGNPVRGVGVLAQEAYEILPRMVIPGKRADGNIDYDESLKPGDAGYAPWMADHSKTVPYLIAAIQDIGRRLAALEQSLAKK